MKTNIFIPKKINVGFRERSDTYTKKLAYIIYYDEKGKLRKEASWNSWRDSKIDNELYDNEPVSGFVLNKKAGGYSTGWNHRQTYVRVYDPRGFEFEISVPNLLYILENATSTKGKGLEGEFIYGWDGTELLLIPTESPDYKDIVELNKLRHTNTFVKAKELKVGATYLGKNGYTYVYMGKFDYYEYDGRKLPKKKFYFACKNVYTGFDTMQTISQKLVSTVSEECVENYAELMDELEGKTYYSPIDNSKDEYVPLKKEDLEEKFSTGRYARFYIGVEDKISLIESNDNTYYYEYKNPNYEPNTYFWKRSNNINEPYYKRVIFKSLDEVIEKLNPSIRKVYLANGKLYSEDY